MNVQNIAMSARLCVRAETMVAEIRLRTVARKFALTGLAILAGLMGLAFVNAAGFAYLRTFWGPVWTPLVIGLANFALAALALAGAAMAKPGPELAVAEELRKLSGGALEAAVQDGISGAGLLSLLGGTRNSNVAGLLLPSVISIVTAMRRRKNAAKA